MSKIKTALISVSDKKNLKPLLNILRKNKVKIISSGGTYKEIIKLKFQCLEVSEFTNSPEVLEGRVKTLHPKIHAGILNKRNSKSHLKDLKKNNYENIDLVIVNFYPFENTLKKTNKHSAIIENIDVGGPTMVRSAAKNYNDVTVITSSDQYEELIEELNKNKGSTTLKFREKLSRIAFTETAYYDSVISNYFNKISNTTFPSKKVIHANLIDIPRYGENPHQMSGIYSKNSNMNIRQIHGKQLSYNNYNDIFAALTISKSLPKNIGTVIVKHANPCGVSSNITLKEAYINAYETDPVSAFGGVIAFNKIVDDELIKNILERQFVELIIAPEFSKKSLEYAKTKKNIRIIEYNSYKKLENNASSQIKNISDGVLIQEVDSSMDDNQEKYKVVSKKIPTKKELSDLYFAWVVAKYVKSNAIVFAKNNKTLGIGAGQMSRIDSTYIASKKAYQQNLELMGAVMASDAFFPFSDNVEKAVELGISAIIQPGGSQNDQEVIDKSDELNVSLVFTGIRHFRH